MRDSYDIKRELDKGEIKGIQLKIMDEVHTFCVEHDITYFLTYGTLIGAIRHKGYIPWDDDIDICMPRPDYNKFMSLFNTSNSILEFISFELNGKYPYPFGKVIDTNTVLIEHTTSDYPLGVYIDVFPIDGINDDRSLLKKQIILNKVRAAKISKYLKNRGLYKNALLKIFNLPLKLISNKFIINKILSNALKHSYENSSKVCCVVLGTKYNKPVSKGIFDKGILKAFEGRSYYVPIGYDEYLNSIFGDYMKLPPEEEQKSHHFFKAYYKEEQQNASYNISSRYGETIEGTNI